MLVNAPAVTAGEITSLQHELRNHAVEHRALVVEGLAGGPDSLLASAQRAEILRRVRHNIGTQLEGDAADGAATDGHVEKNFRVGHDGKRNIQYGTLVLCACDASCHHGAGHPILLLFCTVVRKGILAVRALLWVVLLDP